MAEHQNSHDPDAGKGAVEGDRGNTSLAGQNPHRTNNQFVKANDSDFPEPGNNPEHSGENRNPVFLIDKRGRAQQHDEERPAEGADIRAHRSPERDRVDQDPGERQKENQNQQKDDPLAA